MLCLDHGDGMATGFAARTEPRPAGRATARRVLGGNGGRPHPRVTSGARPQRCSIAGARRPAPAGGDPGGAMAPSLLMLYGSYRSDRVGIRLARFLVEGFAARGARAELVDAR